MQHRDTHLSDQILLRSADGELSRREAARVTAHLGACGLCASRRREIEETIREVGRDYQRACDREIPPADIPRALLKTRVAEMSRARPASWFGRMPEIRLGFSWTFAGLAGVLALAIWLASPLWVADEHVSAARLMIPDPGLTPGATVLMTREQVCRATSVRNKSVSAAVQRAVFREYGIGPANSRGYEVDYLITPALGGADDIHNLWPESYEAIVWNAHVKDQLEDYLRTAQRDLAVNWIEAYKRYFQTDWPVHDSPRDRR